MGMLNLILTVSFFAMAIYLVWRIAKIWGLYDFYLNNMQNKQLARDVLITHRNEIAIVTILLIVSIAIMTITINNTI